MGMKKRQPFSSFSSSSSSSSKCQAHPVDPGQPLLLSPMIASGKLEEARQAAAASYQEFDLGFSGFFSVPSASGNNTNNLFTWLQPCSDPSCNWETAPTMLWMQGGPGAPSTYGALVEVGSYYVDVADCKLKLRCNSWATNWNLVVIDSPTQTGFSYQVNRQGKYDPKNIEYTQTSADTGLQIYQVFEQLWKLWPFLKINPFYIGGESYGGNYVSNTARVFMQKGRPVDGISVGDPVLNSYVQFPTYGNTLYGMSLVNLAQKAIIDAQMQKAVAALPVSCAAAYEAWTSVWNDAGDEPTPFYYQQFSGSSTTYEQLLIQDPLTFAVEADWLGLPQVAKALHYGGIPNNQQNEGGEVYHTMVNSGDFCQNSSEIYASLLVEHGLDVQIYSSTNDPLLGPPTTEAALHAMFEYAAAHFGVNGQRALAQWKAAQLKRVIWPKGQNALGYATCITLQHNSARFCYTVIRNAGHMTPAFQGRAAQDMTQRFFSGLGFDGAGPALPDCPPCGGSPPFEGYADPRCQN